jgi:hypothetical protein
MIDDLSWSGIVNQIQHENVVGADMLVEIAIEKEAIENDLAFENGWYANVTSIDLIFFGMKTSNLHKYYFTHRGKFSSLI